MMGSFGGKFKCTIPLKDPSNIHPTVYQIKKFLAVCYIAAPFSEVGRPRHTQFFSQSSI